MHMNVSYFMVQALLDRIVLVNSESRMLSLYHYDESHAFGLRFVIVLCNFCFIHCLLMIIIFLLIYRHFYGSFAGC